MSKEQNRREHLLNRLVYCWDYTNNTSYNKKSRAQRLSQMIIEITHYIDNEPVLLLKKDERYVLLNLIKWISFFQVEKSAENKSAVLNYLNEFKTLSE